VGRVGQVGRKGQVGQMGRHRQMGLIGRALFAALMIATGCSPKPPDERDYATKVAAARAAKDAEFARGDDPIPRARHAEFLPLAYFSIDPDYNVPGTIKAIDDKTVYEMPTS